MMYSQFIDDLLMIRRQTIHKKQDRLNQAKDKMEITFYQGSAIFHKDVRKLMQEPNLERKGQYLLRSIRKGSQRYRFSTQPTYVLSSQSQSYENSYTLLSKDLWPSFLPIIDNQTLGFNSGSRKNNGNESSWINKLKVKNQVKRIYVQQRQKQKEDLQCWKRIKARTKLLKQIKQEKLRLIALYQRP